MASAGMLEPQIANALMLEIQKIERGTDLKRVAVISRAGMKMASSASDQMDADAETASSAALIDLAERLSDSTQHGNLREIIVKANSGFVILQFVNTEYMVFGGISDPLKVGYYLEYLRNQATKFAYIIAGNKLTDEIKKEIDSQKDREAKAKVEAKKSLAENFHSDKNSQQDMDAMKDVLSFLNDWGGKEAESKPTADNIVSIDKDLLFGMNDADLAPTPISQDQMASAQKTATPQTETSILDDIANVVAGIQPEAATQPAPTPAADGGGLPDDILSALNEISETTKTTQRDIKKAEAAQAAQANPYGIILYDGEVPPIPLTDYVSFEVGSLTGQKFEEAPLGSVATPVTQAEIATPPEEQAPQNKPAPVLQFNAQEAAPDFNAMASEYEDTDLNLEEDAMLQALNELNMTPGKDDKKKKSE